MAAPRRRFAFSTPNLPTGKVSSFAEEDLPEPKPRFPWYLYPLEAWDRLAYALTYKPWFPIKDLSAWDRAKWIATSLIPFGETLGLHKENIPGYESPYEFGSSLAKEGVLEPIGIHPESTAGKTGGFLGGFLTALAFDPTTYLGIGLIKHGAKAVGTARAAKISQWAKYINRVKAVAEPMAQSLKTILKNTPEVQQALKLWKPGMSLEAVKGLKNADDLVNLLGLYREVAGAKGAIGVSAKELNSLMKSSPGIKEAMKAWMEGTPVVELRRLLDTGDKLQAFEKALNLTQKLEQHKGSLKEAQAILRRIKAAPSVSTVTESAQKSASGIGTKALRVATAPIRLTGKILSAPGQAMARLTTPISEGVRKIPYLSFLGKRRSFAAGVTWPFKTTAQWLEKKASQGAGLASSVAQHLLNLGHRIKRLFVQNPMEQSLVREANAKIYSFQTAGEAIDNPSIRTFKAFLDDPTLSPSTRTLQVVTKVLGPEKTEKALNELISYFGGNFSQAFMISRELRKGSEPILESLAAKPGITLSDDAKKLFDAWKTSYGKMLNDLLKLDLETLIREQVNLPSKVRERVLQAATRGGRPWTLSDKRSLIAQMKAERIPGVSVVERLPVMMQSPRVRYAPHVVNVAVRDTLDTKIWSAARRNLLETVAEHSPGLSEKEINRIVNGAMESLRLATAPNPMSRLPAYAHLSAREINEAFWKAGMPKGTYLVSEHAGFALAERGQRVVRRAAARQAVSEGVRASLESPDGAEIYQRLKKAGWLKSSKITNPNNTHVFRGYDSKSLPYMREPTREFVKTYAGGQDVIFVYRGGDKWVPVPRDVGEAIANVNDILLGRKDISEITRTVAKYWDRLSGHAKSLRLNYSLSYHIRNFIDDLVRMFTQEGVDAVSTGLDLAAKLEDGATIRLPFADGVEDFTLGKVRGELAGAGKIGAMFRQEAPEVASWNLAKKASLSLGIWGENFRAEALYLGVLQKYSTSSAAMAKHIAANAVRDALFSYQEITRFEREIPARVIFFYRFLRKSIAFHLRKMIEEPFREFLVVRAAKMGYSPEKPEWKYAPKWVLARGGRPLWSDKEHVTYSSGLGLSVFDTLIKLSPSHMTSEWLSSLNPIIGAPLELAAGKTFFVDREIASNTRLYNKPFANVLSVFNPIAQKLAGVNLVHEAEVGGKRFWMVPGHILWAIGQVRPLNDLRRVLDYATSSGKREGSLGDVIFWVTTGTTTVDVPFSDERLRHQIMDVQEAAELLRNFGLMGKMPIYYPTKGVTVSPAEAEQISNVQQGLQAIAQRRRRPSILGRRYRPRKKFGLSVKLGA